MMQILLQVAFEHDIDVAAQDALEKIYSYSTRIARTCVNDYNGG